MNRKITSAQALASAIRGLHYPEVRGVLNSTHDECVAKALDLLKRLRRRGFKLVRAR